MVLVVCRSCRKSQDLPQPRIKRLATYKAADDTYLCFDCWNSDGNQKERSRRTKRGVRTTDKKVGRPANPWKDQKFLLAASWNLFKELPEQKKPKPIKGQAGWRKARKERLQPLAIKMRANGYSLAQIAHELSVIDKREVTRSTVQAWMN